MRILLVHNRYRQRAGEDAVFDAESQLLQEHGHTVRQFVRDNRDIGHGSDLALAANSIWSRNSYRCLVRKIRQFRPDVIHTHNTLPLISPAVFYAASRCAAPVVQTMHNFRPLCLPGVFFRNGEVCEDCLGRRFSWPGVSNACYRGSVGASMAVASTFAVHRLLRTYTERVDRYIALTDFARDKFIEGGLPAERLVVKPNFTFDRNGNGTNSAGGQRAGALFVGRLSKEKGVLTMIRAWRDIATPLTIVGTGPLMDQLMNERTPGVTLLGELSPDEVCREMKKALFLVMPSEWYEGFALVLVEAYSRGLPVVASRMGAMAEIVEDGKTGLHFNPRDAEDLAAKVRWAIANEQKMREMGRSARRTYERKYSPEENYRQLLQIYKSVVLQKQRSTSRASSAAAH